MNSDLGRDESEAVLSVNSLVVKPEVLPALNMILNQFHAPYAYTSYSHNTHFNVIFPTPLRFFR